MLNLFLQAVPVPAPVNDWLVAAIVALTPVVVMILSWLTDTFKGKMPSWLKPLLATGLGAVLAYLGSVTVDSPLLVAIIGMATVGLREIIVRLGQAFGYFAKPTR